MHLVIIGTGLAGYMLAREWRKLNSTDQLTIITKDEGYYYSKPQLSLVFAQNKSPDDLKLKLVDAMREELNAEVLTSVDVDHIDRENKTVSVGDKNIAYDKLVLAVGAKHKVVPIKGIELASKVNDLAEYDAWHACVKDANSVVIIGSGLVGCEFANDLTRAGKKVTIISPDQFLMQKFLVEPVGRALENAFVAKGVDVVLNSGISEIKKTDTGFEVYANESVYAADCVLSATGIVSNCELALASGLECDNGVCVDSTLQTMDENIFAIGDCAQIEKQNLQYVQPILHGARALAKTLNGETTSVALPIMPVVAKTSLCPITFVLPKTDVEGEWQVEGEGEDLRAEYFDVAGKLHGFILSGKRQTERLQLVGKVVL